jgi:hypothetical protein
MFIPVVLCENGSCAEAVFHAVYTNRMNSISVLGIDASKWAEMVHFIKV